MTTPQEAHADLRMLIRSAKKALLLLETAETKLNDPSRLRTRLLCAVGAGHSVVHAGQNLLDKLDG